MYGPEKKACRRVFQAAGGKVFIILFMEEES